MALLAEQKRKVKFGLDPRNMTWSNDESKFGHKLMEKMGWTKGKGLGANEDGMTDHIKASYKSDSRGLGCTLKEADAWVAHQDDFNDLLKTLNAENTDEVEKKTNLKTTESKRFYGRFSRGRVSTLRSTEDLDCILGKRKSSKSNTVEKESKADKPSVNDDDNTEKSLGLMTTTSTYSVQEYFAKKMAEKKLSAEKPQELDSKEDLERPQFGGPQFGTVFLYGDNSGEGDVEDISKKDINLDPSRGWYGNFLANEHLGDIHDKEIVQSKDKKQKKSISKGKTSESKENKSCGESGSKQKLNKAESEKNSYEEKDIDFEKSSKKDKKRKITEENKADHFGDERITSEINNTKKKRKLKNKEEEVNSIFHKQIDSKNKKKRKSKKEKEVNDSVEMKEKTKNKGKEEANDNIQKTISSEEIYKKRKNKMKDGLVKEKPKINKKRKLSDLENKMQDEMREAADKSSLKHESYGQKHKNCSQLKVNQKYEILDNEEKEEDSPRKKKKRNEESGIVEMAAAGKLETTKKSPKKKKKKSKKKKKVESVNVVKNLPIIKKDPTSIAAEKAFSGSNISDVHGYGVLVENSEPDISDNDVSKLKPKKRQYKPWLITLKKLKKEKLSQPQKSNQQRPQQKNSKLKSPKSNLKSPKSQKSNLKSPKPQNSNLKSPKSQKSNQKSPKQQNSNQKNPKPQKLNQKRTKQQKPNQKRAKQQKPNQKRSKQHKSNQRRSKQ